MHKHRHCLVSQRALALAVIGLMALTACRARVISAPVSPTAPAASGPTATLDRWIDLLQQTPYPFGTPLPPAVASALDGTYVKVDPKEGTPVPCKRCPDYLPEGGVWKLSLHQGIYRIYHPGSGWRSIGSFSVAGNELSLFNDPNCIDVTGRYQWTLADGQFNLTVVDDPCAINLRAVNLTKQPWASCAAPTQEAAITTHWPVPEGCDPG